MIRPSRRDVCDISHDLSAPWSTRPGLTPKSQGMKRSCTRRVGKGPVGSQVIDKIATTSADASVVFALLRDGATWPEWSPIDSFELERAGADEPEGVDAIRVFRTGRYTMREEIVELFPGRRFSYALLSGLPIRDYRVDVDLEPARDGTLIRWHASLASKLPGMGWLIRRRLAGVTEQFVKGLAARAAAIDRGPGSASGTLE